MLKPAISTAVLIGLFLHVLTNDLVHAARILQGSSNGLSLELIPKLFSKKSPVYNASLTPEQRYGQMLQSSRKRSQRLASQSKFYRDSKMNPDTVNPLVFPVKDSMFLVYLRIGTPYQEILLQLDTGSEEIWTQCDGCTTCFQTRRTFKFQQSNTYIVANCDDPFCVPKICSEPDHHFCDYSIIYGDQDTSKGVLAKDDFAFFSKQSNTYVPVKEVRFGCGFENNVGWGTNSGPENEISGIFGMGRGARTFVSQVYEAGQRRFSYCLTNPQKGGTTLMNFGDEATTAPAGFEMFSTPLSTLANPRLYFLNLVQIWMNGVKLNVPANTLPIQSDLTGGMLIDTGIGSTELPGSVFEIIEKEMNNYFGSLGIDRYDASDINTGYTGLELCYAMVRSRDDLIPLLPKLMFEFENNAKFTSTPDGLAVVFDEFFCLQIVESPDGFPHSTLGSFMQTEHYIVYDLDQERLVFGESIGCD